MTGPDVPDDRVTARREHLMHEITAPAPGHRGTRKVALVAGLAALAIGGGTVAVASGRGVWRQDDGVVVIDGAQLMPQYKGRKISPDEVLRLNKDGKAMFGVNNIEAACHGVSLYFDTAAEADAYRDGFARRTQEVAAQRRAAEAQGTPAPVDPCVSWQGPLPTR